MIKDELEKLHYQVIQPSLEQAKCQAGPLLRSCTPGTADPFPVLYTLFQEQMEMRKHELARIVESIDCQSQGMTLDEMDRLIMDLNTPNPDNPFKNYVRPADFGKEGYRVFDGTKWMEISGFSTIHMDDSFGQEVQVYVQDPTTGYRLRIFDDPSTPGIELAESTYGMFPDEMDSLEDTPYTDHTPPSEPESRFTYWESPYYQAAKTGIGVGGIVAGALEYRHVGELIPWKSLENNIGWYTNKKGTVRKLSRQRTGPGPGFHKIGATNAYKRAKVFRTVGKRLFAVSVVMSGYEAYDAWRTEDENRIGVYGKVALDITMGIIGLTNPIGWVISGTYFIGDAFGWWGDWGKSAVQQEAEAEALRQQQLHNQYMIELTHDREFMIEFEKTNRQELLESALKVKDNTELRNPRLIKEIMNN